MILTAIKTVDIPALNLTVEAGKETKVPALEEARDLYAAACGKEPKDVTQADVDKLLDDVLANPYLKEAGSQSANMGKRQAEAKTPVEKKESQE